MKKRRMSGLSTFVWTFFAVVAGIFIYSKIAGKKLSSVLLAPSGAVLERNGKPVDSGAGTFYGPDIDPITGAYLNSGAKPGTVEFNAQNSG